MAACLVSYTFVTRSCTLGYVADVETMIGLVDIVAVASTWADCFPCCCRLRHFNYPPVTKTASFQWTICSIHFRLSCSNNNCKRLRHSWQITNNLHVYRQRLHTSRWPWKSQICWGIRYCRDRRTWRTCKGMYLDWFWMRPCTKAYFSIISQNCLYR